MAKLRVYPECLLHRLFQDNSFSPFLLEQNNVIKITQPLLTDGNQNRKRITVKKRIIIKKKKERKRKQEKGETLENSNSAVLAGILVSHE